MSSKFSKAIALLSGVLRNDPLARLELLRYAGKIIFPSYRFQWHQMDWWENAGFNAVLDRFGERGGMNTHRHWVLGQLARLAGAVPGETAECGVYRGCTSAIICTVLGRRHYLVDSFEGVSAPGAADGTHWKKGDLAASEAEVMRNLESFDVVPLPGWIPDQLPRIADRTFAFVHIDVDLLQPTRDSIEFFYPRLAAGGVLVCDDYGMTSCPGATQAVDEYLTDKPESMVSLPGGGGFIIKGVAVAKSVNY